MKSQIGTDWHDQWRRVKRWYRRLDPIRAQPPEVEPQRSDALDQVFAFFMNCYHLAYWLEADPSAPRRDSHNFITGNRAPLICRDFCNGLKHYRLDPGRKTTVDAGMSTTSFILLDSQETRWFIEHDYWFTDMFDLADECMDAWGQFVGDPWPRRL